MSEALLHQLATHMAGEFDNRQQSLADPTWFLHLRLWQWPLPRAMFNEGYSFFIEQISVASGKPPYRQRILHLTNRDGQIWGQYYALPDPIAYSGAATQPHRLTSLTHKDLIALPTCGVTIKYHPASQTFSARLPENSLCSFTANGITAYVRLKFDLGPESSATNSPMVLYLEDRGVDPDTDKTTWGPLMGPFQLVKQNAFALPG